MWLTSSVVFHRYMFIPFLSLKHRLRYNSHSMLNKKILFVAVNFNRDFMVIPMGAACAPDKVHGLTSVGWLISNRSSRLAFQWLMISASFRRSSSLLPILNPEWYYQTGENPFVPAKCVLSDNFTRKKRKHPVSEQKQRVELPACVVVAGDWLHLSPTAPSVSAFSRFCYRLSLGSAGWNSARSRTLLQFNVLTHDDVCLSLWTLSATNESLTRFALDYKKKRFHYMF